jgi:hypothetical protein
VKDDDLRMLELMGVLRHLHKARNAAEGAGAAVVPHQPINETAAKVGAILFAVERAVGRGNDAALTKLYARAIEVLRDEKVAAGCTPSRSADDSPPGPRARRRSRSAAIARDRFLEHYGVRPSAFSVNEQRAYP